MEKLFKNALERDLNKRKRKRLDRLSNLKNLAQATFVAISSYSHSISYLALSGFQTTFGSGHMCIIVA